MVLIFRIIATYLICASSSLFALGTQFLLIPIDAPNLAIGNHVSSGGSPSVNPSLLQSSKFVPALFFNSGLLLLETVEMPANNLAFILQKDS